MASLPTFRLKRAKKYTCLKTRAFLLSYYSEADPAVALAKSAIIPNNADAATTIIAPIT